MTASEDLTSMLGVAQRSRASDVHLTARQPALMRVDSDLTGIPGWAEPTSSAWLDEAVGGLMSREQLEEFRTRVMPLTRPKKERGHLREV